MPMQLYDFINLVLGFFKIIILMLVFSYFNHVVYYLRPKDKSKIDIIGVRKYHPSLSV